MQFQQSAPGNTTVPGALTVSSITTTAGPDSLAGPLTVAGASTFNGAVDLAGGITGNTTDSGSLTFTGANSVISGLTGSILNGSPMLKIAQINATQGDVTETFANIPQTFSHLLLICNARDTTSVSSQDLFMTFNGTGTANYDYQAIFNTGTGTVSANGTAGQTQFNCGKVTGTTYTSNIRAKTVIWLPHYISTSYQQFMSWTVDGDSTNMFIQWFGGTFTIAGALNKITLFSQGTAFTSTSNFYLYGIP